MTHLLVSTAFVGALAVAGWALYATVRPNWTRIKEALRG